MPEILQIVLLIASIINNVIGIIQKLKTDASNKKTSNHRDVYKKNKKKTKH